MHATGQRYRWTRRLDEAPMQPRPPALRTLVAGEVDELRPVMAGPIREASRYAEAALAGELDKVLAAPAPSVVAGRRVPGARNHTLNRAAYALGQLVGADLLDRRRVEQELAAAARIGLGRVEAARTNHSGLTAGTRNARRPAA